MLKIRLQRVGKKNQASFRIVLAEKARSASKKVTEVLGFYNPRSKQFGIKDPERLQYWIGQHVEISPTMNNLLIDKGLLKGGKVKAWKPKKQAKTATNQTQTKIDKTSPPPSSSPVQGEERVSTPSPRAGEGGGEGALETLPAE